MSNKQYIWISSITSIVIFIAAIWYFSPFEQQSPGELLKEVEENPVETKKARAEYFFNLLRDPATNSIPENIRSRELEHARQLPSNGGQMIRKSAAANQQSEEITWQSAGPQELGGRTRALGIDQRDSDVVIAGGVSGGIWKSTDGGNNWQMKTSSNQNMSVTSLAQDPSNLDTWYYSSGEYRGNSASDRGYTAFYYGTGIYESNDNGETWSLLPSTSDKDAEYNSRFDYISRIKVSPTTGTIFAASNSYGILRSTDDGSTFPIVRGPYTWTDFDIDDQGNIVAVFSTTGSGSDESGIFYSTNDGAPGSWTNITPTDFPDGHDRSVITFAPSDPNIVYVFSEKSSGSTNPSSNQGVSFFKIDISDPQSPTAEDRSANLPDFGDPVGGVNLQGGYNMMVSVKPDDPDFVMIGATNLFRSRDGFATTPSGGYDNSDASQKDEYWIGGYDNDNDVSQYIGQHPDQHVVAYNPNDPNNVWTGHDGGLSETTDITSAPVTWQDTDEGYVTGQFYTVAISSASGDQRIMGGTQDNGTPYYTVDDQNMQQTAYTDRSSGDGSYAHIGDNFIFSSSQLGRVLRWNPSFTSLEYINPINASNELFVHPFEVDPNSDAIMYYPGGAEMWVNTEVNQISGSSPSGTTQGWESFTAVSVSGYQITTLEATKSNPSNRLYYGASGGTPKIYSLDNAPSNESPTDISIPNAPSGAYVHDIAINPEDGDELIVVMSNYNIIGLYHSTDGGSSWSAIEGNLEGSSQNPGPSIRNATILPTSEGLMYLVGTSTGVYSTKTLSGSSTTWTRESDGGSQGSIGYSVAEYIVSRPSDGTIAVGTHGRGIFLGQAPTAPFDITVNVGNSWKLLGSPMASASEASLGSNLSIFGFSGTYQSASAIDPQKGYWVKSRVGSDVQFSGEPKTSATIPLEEGWNIIGGITDTVSTSNISDPNGIRSSSDVYAYSNGSYQTATEIKSGQGYWIHADQSGSIEISSNSSSNKERIVSVPASISKLTFENGQAQQKFFISGNQVDEKTKGKFRMPPEAPEPVIDIRTSDGFRLAEGESTELTITADSYPLNVSLPSNSSAEYILKGVTQQDTVHYEIRSGNDAQIQRPHQKFILQTQSAGQRITEHNLMPNYPNPFNPTTKIRYQVKSQTDVAIEVYNVLGQKVRTLVNEQKSTGSYTVQFDGQNLSSGTYFIHMKAGNVAKVQKMTLIK